MPRIPDILIINDIDFSNFAAIIYTERAGDARQKKGLTVCPGIPKFQYQVKGIFVDLTREERQGLLKIARHAIQSALEGKAPPASQIKTDALCRRSGVFVTLRIGEELRGCIGYVEPVFPLAQATREVAVKAAMEDPRFMPINSSELNQISIEISVLSPLSPLENKEDIEIGRHGLVIDSGYRRGLLLPQVATEYGWDNIQFLTHTSLKAGLSPEAWKQKDVRLYTFTVDKFAESDFS